MDGRFNPDEDGDTVMRQTSREDDLIFVLRTAPGPGQVVVCSRDEVSGIYAKRQHVRKLVERLC